LTPEAIIRLVTAGLEALTETMKFLQSPAGQRQTELMLSDRAKWDSFWGDVGKGLKRFFSGDLFK
jgi:hypothetical protein